MDQRSSSTTVLSELVDNRVDLRASDPDIDFSSLSGPTTTRRGFVLTGLLALAGIGANACSTKLTPANEALQNFPQLDPALATVLKHEEPGATKLLVHIRQMHYVPGLGAKEKAEISLVQSSIEQILRRLIAETGLKGVYTEGVAPETEPIETLIALTVFRNQPPPELEAFFNASIKTQLILCRSLIKALSDNKPTTLSDAEVENLRKLYTAREQELIADGMEALRIRAGAVGRLVYERKLSITSAETAKLNDAHADALNNKSGLKGRAVGLLDLGEVVTNSASEGREDMVLNCAAKGDETVAVTVYGGLHDFCSNIERWNSSHPGEKFSFIEITPRTYSQYSGASHQVGLFSVRSDAASRMRYFGTTSRP
ncbi:MAG: hypothetical protein K1X79_07240 [Oligoflexia bacterium]|nr:hypothetical protein [Oligoflexia bacterium]